MSDLEDEIERIRYQAEKDRFEREIEEAKRLERYNKRMAESGCLIVMGFLTAFAGLAGVTVAKTVSNALDVKQPDSITQPSEKATLISKQKVIHPKTLDNQHLKN